MSEGHVNPRLPPIMKLSLPLFLIASLLLSGCSAHPLGHSHNGSYYGGQGLSNTQKNYVPRDLQREKEIF